MIDRYLHYAETKRNENGLVAYGLGDWLDPFRHKRGGIASPLLFTDSAQIYDISKKAAFLFDKVGLTAQRDYAAWLSGEMRASIRAHLLDHETMTMAGDCQTSQAMALCMGMFEEEELPAARAKLLDIIHREGDITACGVQGMRYIFHALADMGEIDLAYQLLVCESRTCYGHWLANGAESLWESFADAKGKGIDSRNHHFLGDISSFFIQEIAGIRPNPHLTSPDDFEIRPILPTELDHAEAHFDSQRGRLTCSWRRTGKRISIKIWVPVGMNGNLIFDGRVIQLEHGINHFEF
jgi:alpha-L-rhamnosidase